MDPNYKLKINLTLMLNDVFYFLSFTIEFERIYQSGIDKPISNSSGCLIKKIDLFREQSKIDSPDNQSNIPAYWPFPIK
ncbi:hypothetical protein DERF_008876 [Dermatophagoides farinae]|uniref:Uncharacterized protein n=1 Tax=Dermatophagoides farinae TaxID=6954 RepID=A0A922I365_DERFA|nr:hypothetical protein DERF_008876 [Dermatophagoides farinae]